MDNSFLPSKDRLFLRSKGFSFKEADDGAQKGIIIDNFPIRPAGKFSTDYATLLVLLPKGYPDVPPDMFYFAPVITYRQTGGVPDRAHTHLVYKGTTWQRWSRHAPGDIWRPGIDGIQTYLQRVFTALNVA